MIPGIGNMMPIINGADGFSGWTSDSGIESGLSDVGDIAAPTVFDLAGDTYLIIGEYNGNFNGKIWNSTTSNWDTDTGITTGLIDYGTQSRLTVFNIAGDTYAIATGTNQGLIGYIWNGTDWDADTDIVTGLSDTYLYTPTAFDLDGYTYLFSVKSGALKGFVWNSTTSNWDADTDIESGTPDNIYNYMTTDVFDLDGDTYLIIGDYYGVTHGYKWNSTTSNWDADTDIVTGLPVTSVANTKSHPTCFPLLGDTYIIIGWKNGTLSGWTLV